MSDNKFMNFIIVYNHINDYFYLTECINFDFDRLVIYYFC